MPDIQPRVRNVPTVPTPTKVPEPPDVSTTSNQPGAVAGRSTFERSPS